MTDTAVLAVPRAHAGLRRMLACSTLFFAVELFNDVGREAARALAVHAYGHAITVYHYYAIFDPPTSTGEYVAICLASPFFSTLAALVGGVIYVRARSAGVRLFSLYILAFGMMAILNDVMGVSFGGNLNYLAQSFAVPMVFQIMPSVTGGLALIAFMWELGRRLQPPMAVIIVPVVVDLILRPIAYLPIPWSAVLQMWGGSAPWLVAMASAMWHARRPERAAAPVPEDVRLWMSGWMLPVLLILIVRLMVFGVAIGPRG